MSSSSIAKSVGTVCLVSLSGYCTVLTGGKLLKTGNLRARLESMGYLTSLDIKKNQFLKWKRVFLRHRDEVSKIINLQGNSSDNMGAYMLKRWCYQSLNAEYTQGKDITEIKKYCLMSNRDKIMEEDNVEFVSHEELFPNYREFLETEGITNVEDLNIWCSTALDRNFSWKNTQEFKNIRDLCTSVHSN
ncbi:hypothetical protein MHF_0828 [Mycoplasma haemofelis Ohio2]|uniref:Uncharacterized protein n=1 Tax=Mycoplasma haemofelis (strain Ohio2) TaxID=859194 RepID=F6FIP4_MYCHI|nr:hypothetical protein MHF_0828 [Mycoplasma haemofelis Ohio2]